MICIYTGLPGAGKSLMLARTVLGVLERNRKWANDPKNPTKMPRKVLTKLKMGKKVMDEYGDMIEEWNDTRELVQRRDVDVIWDEMATDMDCTQWQNMSLELKRWLQQHRKFGIEIYGTAQDFAQVDKAARRLVSDLVWITKLIGSPDPSPTRPPPKHIWGICLRKDLDPLQYNEAKSKFEGDGIPMPFFFSREDVEVFDTRAEVKQGEYPPLRHVCRTCELPACDHVKISHI